MRGRLGDRSRQGAAADGARAVAIHTVHAEDGIRTGVAAVERVVVIHLHHDEHECDVCDAQPQHIQDGGRLEPAEHA